MKLIMYKVLLVDDEILIREAIQNHINWENLGYILVDNCQNGKEAMDILENTHIDLLITDICMPYVDGLELTKYVYENYPLVKVIILSGYSDFNYAKEALKYHVLDYVLKPVTIKELNNLLIDIKKNLSVTLVSKHKLDQLEYIYEKNRLKQRQDFLLSMLSPEFNFVESIKKDDNSFILDELKSYMNFTFFASIIIQVYIPKQDCKSFRKSDSSIILNELHNQLQAYLINNSLYYPTCIEESNHQLILFYGSDKKDKLLEFSKQLYNHYFTELFPLFSLELSIGVGESINHINKFHISYHSAVTALNHTFLYKRNTIIQGDSLIYSNDLVAQTISTDSKDLSLLSLKQLHNFTATLIPFIRYEKEETIHQFIKEVCYSIQHHHLNKVDTLLLMEQSIIHIDKLNEYIQEFQKNFIPKKESIIQKLREVDYLSEIEDILLLYCHSLYDILKQQRNKFDRSLALDAKEYIDLNYASQELTLNHICNHFSVSVSYFSYVYKYYNEETFIESLTKKRIQKSMDLILDTSYKIYEIADLVGYSDPQYFATLFKKHTGHSPKSFLKERLLHHEKKGS